MNNVSKFLIGAMVTGLIAGTSVVKANDGKADATKKEGNGCKGKGGCNGKCKGHPHKKGEKKDHPQDEKKADEKAPEAK